MSMSRKANPWDNAIMDSFFGSLKIEWIAADHVTEAQTGMKAFKYTEVFYNPVPWHSAFYCLSPPARRP